MISDGAAVARMSAFAGGSADPRSYLQACYPKAEIAPLDHVVLTADPLVARINNGMWIASCSCGAPPARGAPTPGMIVFLDRPLGWCVRCGNQAWGGGWRRVVAPPVRERAAIESVLLCRPNVGDRNWEPGETIADLVAQNAEHGDPYPEHFAEAAIGPLHGPHWREFAAPFSGHARAEGGPRWWQKILGRR